MSASDISKLVVINKKNQSDNDREECRIELANLRGEGIDFFKHSFHEIVGWHTDFQRLTT